MTASDDLSVQRLRAYLDAQPVGVALDPQRVGALLANCWPAFEGGRHTEMRPGKLWRMEKPQWTPPLLRFLIERHGQTAIGSSRARRAGIAAPPLGRPVCRKSALIASHTDYWPE